MEKVPAAAAPPSNGLEGTRMGVILWDCYWLDLTVNAHQGEMGVNWLWFRWLAAAGAGYPPTTRRPTRAVEYRLYIYKFLSFILCDTIRRRRRRGTRATKKEDSQLTSKLLRQLYIVVSGIKGLERDSLVKSSCCRQSGGGIRGDRQGMRSRRRRRHSSEITSKSSRRRSLRRRRRS